MSLILYEHPLSPYAQKVKIALNEKGLAYEVRMPGATQPGKARDEFLALNPRGEVPTLVDGDVAIFDSTIILEYLEDKWPSPALLPAGPAARAKARMIEDELDTQAEAINWAMGEIQWFKRAQGALAQTLERRAASDLAKLYRWLERQLGTDEWFGGASFGWADLSAVPYLNGASGLGFPPPAGSGLSRWLERANARPTVASVRAAAEASLQGMTMVAALIEQRLMKREYRDHRLEWMIRSGGLDIVTDGIARDNIRFSYLPE